MATRRRRDGIAARITAEAARLALDERRVDLAAIRRKAAQHLGCNDQRAWPDLAEVAAAIKAEQRLFRGPAQAAALVRLRRLAAAAMQTFAAFAPRLVGPVLEGTADEHTPVRLLLQAETPEDVIFTLTDHKIPWRANDVRLFFPRGRQETRPCLTFQAGDTRIELIVLGPSDRANPPVDPERDRPLRSATLERLSTELRDAD